MTSNARRNVKAADSSHLQHVHVSYPRKGTLEQPSMPGGWRRDGSDAFGRITGAGRRLTSWLRALGPRRALLGLEPAAPAPYRPHNRARMAKRRARRHMVARSRRANRR